jgi:hypothetical protein
MEEKEDAERNRGRWHATMSMKMGQIQQQSNHHLENVSSSY